MHLQVIGTSTDANPTVILSTEQKRIVFNAGEGLQRMGAEHKVKLSKISDVFLTRLSTDTFGGLPGMLLTMRDMGITGLRLHAPWQTASLLEAGAEFVRLENLTLRTLPLGGSSGDADIGRVGDLLAIRPVRVPRPRVGGKRAGTARTERAPAKRPRVAGSTTPAPVPGVMSTSTDTKTRMLSDSPVSPSDVFCFVCRTRAAPGAFDVKKAKSIGIPPGPVYGELKSGRNVECKLRDGTTRLVRAAEVVGPSRPGVTFAIIDCPTRAHIPGLLSTPELGADAEARAHRAPFSCVIHFSPRNVVSDPRYRRWAEALAGVAAHRLVHPSCCGLQNVWAASELNLMKLRLAAPNAFPRPPPPEPSTPPVDAWPPRPARHLEKFWLVPARRVGWDCSAVLPSPTTAALRTSLAKSGVDVDHILPLLRAFREADDRDPGVDTPCPAVRAGEVKKVGQLPTAQPTRPPSLGALRNVPDARSPFLLFLGTGSALPSKYRNVSGIYLDCGGTDRFGALLDCGEGSLTQLARAVGGDRTALDAVLCRLRLIWVSHLHADHHLGVLTVLLERERAGARAGGTALPTVLVAGPHGLEPWLRAYAGAVGASRVPFNFMANHRLTPAAWAGRRGAAGAAARSALRGLGLVPLATCRVNHCPDAWAVALTHRDGWKVAYSGDCRPDAGFARLGQGAHVLVHEATFEDRLGEEAIAKKHSTASEAVRVGRQMRAACVLLTHFSQRYPKIPSGTGGGKGGSDGGPHVCVAFDLMRVRFNELARLSRLVEPFRCLFPAETAEVDGMSATDAKEPPAQDE